MQSEGLLQFCIIIALNDIVNLLAIGVSRKFLCPQHRLYDYDKSKKHAPSNTRHIF